MLLINCPHCGARDEAEFSCGGEAHIARPLAENAITDAQFADYLFYRHNPKGIFLERWRHAAGCRKWFNAVRNTVTDEVLEIYDMGAMPKTKVGKEAYADNWRRATAAEKAASTAEKTAGAREKK